MLRLFYTARYRSDFAFYPLSFISKIIAYAKTPFQPNCTLTKERSTGVISTSHNDYVSSFTTLISKGSR